MEDEPSKPPGVRRAKGRPPLPRDEARSQRVVTFVTEQDKAKLIELAEGRSTSLSAVCFELIAQGLRRIARTREAGPRRRSG